MGGGPSGGTTTQVTQPEIPEELKSLMTGTAGAIQQFQPAALQYFNYYAGDPNRQLQVSPMTGLENALYETAGLGLNRAANVPLGFESASNFLLPYGDIGTQATTGLMNAMNKGGAYADMPYQGTQALGTFYDVLGLGQQALQGNVGKTPEEIAAAQALAGLPGIASQTVGTPPAEEAALQQLNFLTSGALGTSPSTQQASDYLWHQYNTRGLPSLQNQLGLAGLGRSGAMATGINDLQAQVYGAMVPLLQQEVSNRGTAAQALSEIAGQQSARGENPILRQIQAAQAQASGYGQLGGQTASRQLQGALGAMPQVLGQEQFEMQAQQLPIERQIAYQQSLFPALTQGMQLPLQAASGLNQVFQNQVQMGQLAGQVGALPRELQQQTNQAQLQDDLRRQGIAESMLLGPMGIFPSSIGSTISGTTNTSGGGGMFGS